MMHLHSIMRWCWYKSSRDPPLHVSKDGVPVLPHVGRLVRDQLPQVARLHIREHPPLSGHGLKNIVINIIVSAPFVWLFRTLTWQIIQTGCSRGSRRCSPPSPCLNTLWCKIIVFRSIFFGWYICMFVPIIKEEAFLWFLYRYTIH